MSLAAIAATAFDAIAAGLPDVRQTVEWRTNRRNGGEARVFSFPVVAIVAEGADATPYVDEVAPSDADACTLRVKYCDWSEYQPPRVDDLVRLAPRGRGVAVYRVSNVVDHRLGEYYIVTARKREDAEW